ncbi:MAG: RluA family pseudouridine synthase [Pseudomonadota bacterium]
MTQHQVGAEDAGQRLDRWLRKTYPALPQSLFQRLLRSGQIRLDGKRAKAATPLQLGQILRLPPQLTAADAEAAPPRGEQETPEAKAALESLRAGLLYEDRYVLALNKPVGLAVQGGSGQRISIDRLAAGLVPPGAAAPRLVHRLDRDTSGVLLLAKTAAAARHLAESFKGRSARKLYWALVQGVPRRRAGRIDRALAKQGQQGQERMQADPEGQAAETLYATAATAGAKASLLVLAPLTGRTHQIRAHLAAIGHPILGDFKYGATKQAGEAGLLLHAAELAVPHPEDETTLRIAAPAPAAFLAACQSFGFETKSAELAVAQLEARGA